MKEKGVILPIFSLPSKYGIGDFGDEAYEFIDILSKNKIKYWVILPINACNRLPYAPLSYYALDENYLSLDKLKECGLVGVTKTRENKDKVIYDNYKEKYYIEAFNNFKENDDYYQFIESVEINEYAEYMSDITGKSKEYYLVLQYLLYSQWMKLKKYANSRNIEIIGDMPMYPSFNSVETKYHSEFFQMENGEFKYEAGTPPDYFSRTGQRWGTPVYDVKNIKKDNYKYLIKRVSYYLKLFDKIRIDHFLGYDHFFKIPIGKLGRDGFYEDGVGYGFFDELFKNKNIGIDNFIVEDLGNIREETIKLREYYGFTGQRILQSTIDLEILCDNKDDNENIMLLPGNHDCQTIFGWYQSLSNEYKDRVKEFLRKHKCSDKNINIGIMQYCMKCKAKIVVVTAQDILGLNNIARINIPGTDSDKNWSWKLKDFDGFKEKIKNFN